MHSLRILNAAVLGAGIIFAQAPAPDPKPAPQYAVGPVEFSGLVDVYYSVAFNHPASRTNNLRNFDVRANQFSLNMAKLEMQHAPDPVGFRLDLGVGRAWDLFHFAEPLKDGISIMRQIPQAYISLAPPKAGGLTIDVGKFYTSAGAELTENNLTWSYSRALLYANGPYYHFGLRVAKPITKWWTGGFQVINGWNNVEDNNSGKTFGFTSAMTGKKVSWFNNYYVGPEKTNTNKGYRHFWDTVLNLNPSDRANFYVNFDYGADRCDGVCAANASYRSNSWWGIAFAQRYWLNKNIAISPRVEYYKDNKGFITGTAQALKEFTMTFEYKFNDNFLSRLEYRRDWSDRPFFDRGNELANAKAMSTVTLGFVAFFASKK